ncbi:MAG: DegT/DnrJ/EryC1/StrS family aminotransferase [Ferruginibacter sp.]|nr:DegT/DnrJ/EryC1/StrS family aminotransferase [Ferruginibacter sp.]
MITVTKPYLPDIAEYEKYVKKIFASGWLTNNGPLVQELEKKLKEYLGVKHLFFTGNGTIAIQIAIKALELKGEIITTPFSYVATTNSILWEGCTPVFADIKNTDFNIDPGKIESLITENTSAILATHVYGNPCDVVAIKAIADKNNLKVIYDGAHAFGTRFNNQQVLAFGDIATCSFHATKLFHTIEGGCIITNDDDLAEKIMLYRQFGHIGDEYYSIGVNGKNSEFHAAMGLCILPQMEAIISKRALLINEYNTIISELKLQTPGALANTSYNYAYYPVLFENEQQLVKAKEYLANCSIFTRRYFYPSLNKLPFAKGNGCPVSENISPRVLALPLYHELEVTEVQTIGEYLKKFLHKKW